MTSNASSAFNEIRPYCVEFIQTRNFQSLRKLHKKLHSLPQENLDEIALYILFPFRVILRNEDSKNEEFLTCTLDCLSHIFAHAAISDWNVVSEILTQLCGVISNSEDNDMDAHGSEELKGGVAKTINKLFEHACLPLWRNLYHFSNIPLLGHIVTLLLSISKENTDRQTRLTALQALKSLCHPEYLSLFEESEQNSAAVIIGDSMACFLPGVTTALSKIITWDSAAGFKIKSFCLDVLGIYITATLSDKNTSPSICTQTSQSDVNPRLKSLIITRDDKWVTMVTKKLEPIIESACSASNSEEWKVRLSCVNFCNKILLDCRKNMKNHANTLLKVPVKLLNDDYKEIKQECSQILKDYSTSLQEKDSDSRILVEILEENLFAMCTSLPRYMRTMQDSEKSSTLKILLGYLTLLKNKINNLLYSLPHLKKLSSALLHSFELDTSSIQLMDIVTSSDSDILNDDSSDLLMTSTCFRKEFCHFRNKDVFDTLKCICNVLGQYGDLDVLVDYFLEIYNNSESNCKQSVLILNEILLGAKDRPSDENLEILRSSVKTVLDEYLCPENWYLVTRFDSEYLSTHHQTRTNKISSAGANMTVMPMFSANKQRELSLKAIKSNVLLCCLHLEAILTFSKVMGKSFRTFLMYALYPLLEKTTDQDSSISSCAVRALQGVAINCGYNSSSALVAENADYLISDISIQIHKLEVFPRCPAVLQAMLDHSNSDILALVCDTVDEILQSLDLHHLNPTRLIVFLPVLLSVVKAVNRWCMDKSYSDESENGKDCMDEKLYEKDETTTAEQQKKSGHAYGNGGEKFSKSINPKPKKNTCQMNPVLTASEKVTNIHSTQYTDSFTSSQNSSRPESIKLKVENLKNQLLELHKNKKIADLDSEVEIDPDWKPGQEEDTQYQHPDESDVKKKPPMEIVITTKVLSRCIHLMAHSDPKVRMKVMDIIECGMTVLSSQENELLPMAHKLWKPLVVRFGDKELQVVMKAFDTLCVIAYFSKDFLRKRFCKEILPKILSVLQDQSRKSVGLSKNPFSRSDTSITTPWHKAMASSQDTVAYTHSVAFKLQQKALQGLGPLVKDVEINRSDLIKVSQACLSYLSVKQPSQLQNDALTLFRNLIEIDSDVIWLQLTGLWCQESTLRPPDRLITHPMGKNLQTVHLAGDGDPKNEFANNVKKLLEFC